MAAFFLWCILLVFCWPIAILALIAYPFVWLILLPFAALLVPLGAAWCLRRRINPLRAAGALWGLLSASRGAAIEVVHPDVTVQVHIV